MKSGGKEDEICFYLKKVERIIIKFSKEHIIFFCEGVVKGTCSKAFRTKLILHEWGKWKHLEESHMRGISFKSCRRKLIFKWKKCDVKKFSNFSKTVTF